MNETWPIELLFAAMVLGTPLIFATIGEIIAERSGILNLGVQGMMLVGAVSAFWATYNTNSLMFGLLAGLIAAAVLSMLHAFTSVTLRVSQIVSGLALTLFGTGLASFFGRAGSDPLVGNPSKKVFDPILTGGITEWPIVGPVLFGHDILVYAAWITAGAASYYLFRTKTGLALRAVGEDPASAEAAGVNVALIRYAHVMVGGALAGIGGAYYSLKIVPTWQDDPLGEAGWIAIALVILASWRPWRAIFAAYLFGAAERVQFTLQTLGEPWSNVPSTLLAMIPFILAIAAMIALTSGKRARFLGAPAALGISYFREQR